MEYKRLTTSENIHRPYALECFKCFNKECNRCEIDYAVWERLAELEDKIEQGTLIELPRIVRIVECSVEKFVVQWEENGRVRHKSFLVEKEAEKRLKELQE